MPAELRLSKERLAALGRLASEQIALLLDAHSEFLSDLNVWWDRYEGRPLSPRRSFPFENSSNVVIPLTRIHVDASVARLVNAIFRNQRRLFTVNSRDEELAEAAAPLTQLLNWSVGGADIDLMPTVQSWLTEAAVVGEAVLYLTFEDRKRWLAPPDGESGPILVRLARGPRVFHVPRESIVWTQDREVHEAEFVARRVLMTWGELLHWAQQVGVPEERLERVRGNPSELDAVTESKLARRGIEPIRELYAVWECWMELTPTGEEPEELRDRPFRAVVWVVPQVEQVLRVIPMPYLMPWNPFYLARYRVRPGQPYGSGIAEALDHLQQAVSTLVNQAIDSVTIANSLNFVTTNPRLLEQPWQPNVPLLLDSMDEFREVTVGKNVVPDIAMMNSLLAMAERLTGVSDPALGREIRLGGHPSPATSTLTMLQEGRQPLSVTMRGVRRELSRLGLDILALIGQFATERDIQRAARGIGKEDAAVAFAALSLPPYDRLEVDLRSASEAWSPEVLQRQSVLVDQMAANYYARVVQALQLAESQQVGPAAREALLRSVDALSRVFVRFLESVDVDDPESFVVEVMRGAVGEAEGAVPQQPMGTLPGAAPPLEAPVGGAAGPVEGGGEG